MKSILLKAVQQLRSLLTFTSSTIKLYMQQGTKDVTLSVALSGALIQNYDGLVIFDDASCGLKQCLSCIGQQFKFGHCKVYLFDSECAYRLELGTNGFTVQRLEHNSVYQDTGTVTVPFHFRNDVINEVQAFKRFALVNQIYYNAPMFRFSIGACLDKLVSGYYPFFNCSSVISFILWGTILDTPKDLYFELMGE